MFDIKDPNKFLGGQNVHNLLILAALGVVIYKQCQLQKEFKASGMEEFSNAGGLRKFLQKVGLIKMEDATVCDCPGDSNPQCNC
tara:strand:+ start:1047 stop:1298 length:252 start_codon:yes stop_codon:yes gene_type:complete